MDGAASGAMRVSCPTVTELREKKEIMDSSVHLTFLSQVAGLTLKDRLRSMDCSFALKGNTFWAHPTGGLICPIWPGNTSGFSRGAGG